jgi:hypothetical protein
MWRANTQWTVFLAVLLVLLYEAEATMLTAGQPQQVVPTVQLMATSADGMVRDFNKHIMKAGLLGGLQ